MTKKNGKWKTNVVAGGVPGFDKVVVVVVEEGGGGAEPIGISQVMLFPSALIALITD